MSESKVKRAHSASRRQPKRRTPRPWDVLEATGFAVFGCASAEASPCVEGRSVLLLYFYERRILAYFYSSSSHPLSASSALDSTNSRLQVRS